MLGRDPPGALAKLTSSTATEGVSDRPSLKFPLIVSSRPVAALTASAIWPLYWLKSIDIRMATPVAISATNSTTTPMTTVLRRIRSLLLWPAFSRINDRPCRGRTQVSRERLAEMSQSPDGFPSGLDVRQRLLGRRGVEAEKLPGRRHMPGQRRLGGHDRAPRAALRPRQYNAPGMEMEAFCQVDTREKGSASAVFAVAQDGRPHLGAMDTKLMGASGLGHEGEPGRAPPGVFDHAGTGDGAPAFFIRAHALAMHAALLGQRQVDASGAELRQADHDRPIDLPRLLVAEGFGEPAGRRGVTCQHENAAGVFVQAVDEARALGRAETQGIEQRIDMQVGTASALNR